MFESMAIPLLRKIQRGEAGKLFTDWIEQFELPVVASVCLYDDHAKLVNLTTRLRGQAFAFYQSCSAQQQNNYTILVSELRKHLSQYGCRLYKVAFFMTESKSQMEVWMPMHKNCKLYFTVLTLKHSKDTGDRTNGPHHASKSVCCWIKARYQS